MQHILSDDDGGRVVVTTVPKRLYVSNISFDHHDGRYTTGMAIFYGLDLLKAKT